jgi:hypothetical protein
MKRTHCITALAAAGIAVSLAISASAQHSHELLSPDAIKWQPMPREWTNGPPPSSGTPTPPPEIALMWGDPTKEGEPFMFRLRPSKPGIVPVPLHSHPTDEHITVLSGIFCVGTGDKFDAANCKDMPAGSHIMLPKDMQHFAVAKDSVLEVYGIGPFKINWVK